MNNNFIKEETDTGEEATLYKLAEILQVIPDIVKSNINIKAAKKSIKDISKILLDISNSENIEKDLENSIFKLENKLILNKQKKKRYLDLKKAEQFAIRISNENILKNKDIFCKTKTLKKEEYIIKELKKKKLRHVEICKYLNEIYRDKLKYNKLEEFKPRDISFILSKTR